MLAASAFSQREDPGQVVTEFVQESEKWRGTGYVPSVKVQRTPNDQTWFDGPETERTLTASADAELNTGGLLSMPNANYFNVPRSTVYNRDNVMNGTGGPLAVNTVKKIKRSYINGTQVTRWTKAQALQNVEKLCDFTKNVRSDGNPFVRVFTIGFDLKNIDFATYTPPATAADASSREDQITFVLDHCATFDEDRYLATSKNLDETFDDILSQINKLRLTN